MTVYRTLFLALVSSIGMLFPGVGMTQSIQDLQKGVVKITAHAGGQQPRVGAGFIVRLEPEVAYIVTAAHVVEGDARPRVTFFHQPLEW